MAKRFWIVCIITIGLSFATSNFALDRIPNLSQKHVHLSPFGFYGKNKIGLFKWGNECLVSIQGKNSHGITQSVALWLPDAPDTFYIFPAMSNVRNAVRMLDDYFKKNYPDFKHSYSYLELNNQSYELYGDGLFENGFPLLVTKLTTDPTPSLTDNKYFIVKLKNFNDSSAMQEVTFELRGFIQAMRTYETYCSK